MGGLSRIVLIGSLGFVAYANRDLLLSSQKLLQKVEVEATSGIEMKNIARAVVMHYINENRLPLKDVPGWMRESMRQAAGEAVRDFARDPWGTEYQIRVRDTRFAIGSAGPDKLWNTEDDLRVVQPLEDFDLPGKIRVAIRASLEEEGEEGEE